MFKIYGLIKVSFQRKTNLIAIYSQITHKIFLLVIEREIKGNISLYSDSHFLRKWEGDSYFTTFSR